MQWINLMHEAVQANAIVCDEASPADIFSKSLVYQMSRFARRQFNSRLKTIYVPDDLTICVGEWFAFEDHPEIGREFKVIGCTIYGVAASAAPPYLTQLYKDSGCLMPWNKVTVILGVCENGRAFLGAY